MRQLGYILGIDIYKNEDNIHVHQAKYISEVLEKAQYIDTTLASPPIATRMILFKFDGVMLNDNEATLYRTLVRGLSYSA